MPTDADSRRILDDLRLTDDVLGLFESVPGLHFFIKDRDGRLIYCNATHRHRLFRYAAPDALYGKENRDFFPDALAVAFAADDRRVIASGTPIVERVELNLTHDARLAWFSTTKVPARNGRGEIVGLLGISRMLEDSDRLPSGFDLLLPAIDYIRKHGTNRIQIPALAKACRLTPQTFHRHFKALFRMTPTAFVMRLRIHEASLRLTGADESIAAVARRCGFDDQNLFARRFKQAMGLSPTEFRRHHAPGKAE